MLVHFGVIVSWVLGGLSLCMLVAKLYWTYKYEGSTAQAFDKAVRGYSKRWSVRLESFIVLMSVCYLITYYSIN